MVNAQKENTVKNINIPVCGIAIDKHASQVSTSVFAAATKEEHTKKRKLLTAAKKEKLIFAFNKQRRPAATIYSSVLPSVCSTDADAPQALHYNG